MNWFHRRRTDWRSFRDLCGREKALLCTSLVLLPAVAVAHRLLGLRRSQWILHRLTPDPAPACRSGSRCWRLAQSTSRVIQIAQRRIPLGASCLEQAVLLHWLLARQGVVTDIRFGVSKRDGNLQAHAWVECLDRALPAGEDLNRRFTPFPQKVPATTADRQ